MAGVDLNTEERSGARAILLRGTLRAADLGRIWRRAIALAGRARDQKLILDLSGVDGCDTAGAVLMLEIEKTHGGAVAIEGASERVAALIARVRETSSAEAPPAAPPSPSLREQAHAGWIAATEGFAFLGEAAVAILRLPRRIRPAFVPFRWCC
jgi:ABC-type transporter Mla MlaB component